jgi:uncharacterized protein YbaR (Trm112 family)
MTDTTPTFKDSREAERIGISEELLAIMVCPVDHAALQIDGAELVCTQCNMRFPVQNGIPNMVVE